MIRRTPRQQDAIARLEPWQREIVDAVLDRRNVSVVLHKRHARHRLAVLIGALYELEGRRWDAAGPERDVRELRRQARELAAHLDCPCEPDDA